MKKQPELTAQTKKNLTDAFWQIYCTKRIDKITVKEITAKAQYNRGTFYEYFIDVYDVLEQIEDSLLPKLEELPPLNTPRDTQALPLGDFIKMYEEHSKYYIVLLGDNGDPSFLNKLKNNLKPKLKQMLITQGAPDNFELDYTIEFTLAAMIGVLSYWYKQENKPPTEKLLNLIHDIMHEGVMKKLLEL
ncbi:MAG: TetR/AcrR family transcriptional regulator [Gorillibacterium sp.]|nr:TetR/AcrR family transcriptional regulator [Gorillibacterium sp.]